MALGRSLIKKAKKELSEDEFKRAKEVIKQQLQEIEDREKELKAAKTTLEKMEKMTIEQLGKRVEVNYTSGAFMMSGNPRRCW